MASDTEGLVGWWPLHSDTPVDLSGQGNHGTNNGATPGVAGKGGLTAYSFDGSGDYIDIGTGTYTPVEFSLGAWVKTLDGGDVSIIDLGGRVSITIGDQSVNSNDGQAGLQIYDGTDRVAATSTSLVDDDNWHYIVGTYENNTINIYVDGNNEDSKSQDTPVYETSRNQSIGGYGDNNNQYVNGLICDVRVYNRALSSSEIQTLYEWGSGDYARPPVDGISRYALDGDATDQWGNNDGTVNGASVTSDAIRGQAYSFDGTDDLNIPYDSSLNPSSVTVSLWVNSDGSDNGLFGQSYYSSGDITPYQLRDTAGSHEWHSYDGSSYLFRTTAPIITGWSHIVGSYDPSLSSDNAKLYVNGSLASTDTYTGGFPNSSRDFIIGDYNGNGLSGNIDDVRIYDYALSPQEIHDLYRWGTFGRDWRAMTVRA